MGKWTSGEFSREVFRFVGREIEKNFGDIDGPDKRKHLVDIIPATLFNKFIKQLIIVFLFDFPPKHCRRCHPIALMDDSPLTLYVGVLGIRSASPG